MNLITVDFETYYDKTYNLSKLTTEEYIRSQLYQTIGVAVKVNNGKAEWASGTHEQLKEDLHTYDWENSILLAHNCAFDGAIASWLFDIHPRAYADTLCIARALHGVEAGGSLAKLAKRYNIGTKGEEVVNALGKHREDFTKKELAKYGDYCINDVELCFELFKILGANFPASEMKVIDTTLKMFVEPKLKLNVPLLNEHLIHVKQDKAELLKNVGATKKELMSNPKFAGALKDLGVSPPIKTSPTTGKETYAFAKTDKDFLALQEHPDIRVQALMAARMGSKSTLEETRTERLLNIAARGNFPVPIKYYAAHTGRFGGWDNVNIQNLPSRKGKYAKVLKKAIIAPPKHMLIDCDSSQIEARVLAWWAEQNDLVEAFRNDDPVYEQMAAEIYEVPIEEVTPPNRFVGKTTILGSGYGMGALRLQMQLKTEGIEMELDECRRVINVYRSKQNKIKDLWKTAQSMLAAMNNDTDYSLGREGVVSILPKDNAVQLPNGLLMRYGNLSHEAGQYGPEFSYSTRKGRVKIYGGKVVENICQALARIIITDQMLQISKKCKVVLMVHDSIVVCVHEVEVAPARKFIEKIMRTPPTWAEGLPLNCASGCADAYGDC
jgi:DNA polymerase|tara:strand:+ start:2496 stop:4322 length:1827 start_codon:yes stop_codon:yes gene_type:complete